MNEQAQIVAEYVTTQPDLAEMLNAAWTAGFRAGRAAAAGRVSSIADLRTNRLGGRRAGMVTTAIRNVAAMAAEVQPGERPPVRRGKRRAYLAEATTGWIEPVGPGLWRVLNGPAWPTDTMPAWGELVELEPDLDDDGYRDAPELPRIRRLR